MIRSVAHGSDLHGRMNYACYEPKEFGVDNVLIAAGGASILSNVVCIAGYQHFQIWFQTTAGVTIEVFLKGIHPTLHVPTNTITCKIATIITGADCPSVVYWGIFSVATSLRTDTLRFGRYARFQFRNTHGTQDITINAWLEMMG